MRKQSLEHNDFLKLKLYAKSLPYSYIKEKVKIAKKRINDYCLNKKTAFAWSGGKDSIGLEICCEEAGISDCVMAISDLEYPEFLQWVTVNMPDGLTVINSEVDIEYIKKHPEMLFPQNAKDASRWFKSVQHKVQNIYFKENNLDVIILGRRLEDGNFIGRNQEYWYTSKGVTRLSPIYDWTHIDIFCAIHHYKKNEPPFYRWNRGYRCGTHSWAARQWCKDVNDGWRETYEIDRSIVHFASKHFNSAKEFLRCVA